MDINWTNKKRKRIVDDLNNAKKKRSKHSTKNNDDDDAEHSDNADDGHKDHDKNHDKNSRPEIYSKNNHVYFYSSIDSKSIIALKKETDKTIERILNEMENVSKYEFNYEVPPIVLHIWSPGGGIFAAFVYIDYMNSVRKKYKNFKFHSVIEGNSASAATLISITADKRYITEYGYMLIHELSSGMWGKYKELKDDMKNNEELMERIRSLYKKHAKIPKNKLNEILSHDLYWDADTCLKHGLVDEIV